MFKQIRRMMSLAMLMPSFLLAAPDYKQKFTQILDFISNDFIKAIGGLIIVGTCIFTPIKIGIGLEKLVGNALGLSL
ncbi:hypothetical protein MPG81_06645 [Helicobacter pylori]|nr:hypothetical protein [Helicobacter pylori]UOS47783.1 hypothetical protein MPG81_06645 [Helicobacter pylori]